MDRRSVLVTLDKMKWRKELKKIKLVLMLAFLIIFLMGCGSKITEGEVYEKEFKPEESVLMMIPIVHSDGKTCSTTLIPVWYHYPDRWCIRIRSINQNEDGNYDTAEYYTTEEVYNCTDVGNIFSYEPERDFTEEPVVKEK